MRKLCQALGSCSWFKRDPVQTMKGLQDGCEVAGLLPALLAVLTELYMKVS
jgi:hypothetical protein